MDWIAARYKDCLCRVCLEQIAMGELGPKTTLSIQYTEQKVK
ncbi:MAG TPA: hypothetical protein PKD12_02345 [Nitrospira sp.]|nr:hypothetical protein [Nitrospira sp.]